MAKWYWINPPTWVINMDIITDITQKNTRYGCHVGMTLDFKAPKVGICNFDVNDRNGTSSNCGFDAAIASSFGQKSTERLSTEMEETYRIYRYLESTAFRKKNLVILVPPCGNLEPPLRWWWFEALEPLGVPKRVSRGYHKRFGSKGNKDVKRPIVESNWSMNCIVGCCWFFLTWLLVENKGKIDVDLYTLYWLY